MKTSEIQYKSIKIDNISENSPLCSGLVMTLTHSNRSIECSNTRKSIGNGFPMKKYVGAMVRKSFQLVIAAEIEPFENKSSGTKKTHLPGALNKNKTIIIW